MLAGIFGKERRMMTDRAAPGPTDSYWYRPVGESGAGITITPDVAMSITAVYACVRVISETLATLPLIVYKRLPNGGKERATTHPLYNLLQRTPNRWQTRVEFIEMLAGHVALRGNGYAEIVPGRRGSVDQLIPIHPDRVDVRVSDVDGMPVYRVRRFPDNKIKVLLDHEMLHIRGLSGTGYKGVSPITLAREAIGLAKQTERHGASLFSNKAIPGGVLQHPDQIGEEAITNLRNSLGDIYTGAGGWHKPLILEEGMTWQQISLTAEDAQFLETRKFQVIEIARLFRVPPHMIQDLEQAHLSNVEQMAIDFVMHTMRPVAVRFEQALCRDLIARPDTYFVEFLIDGLMRGDGDSRASALQTQFMNGAITIDEWREIENRNPLPNGLGKRHYVPVNLQPVDALVTAPAPAALPTPPDEAPAEPPQKTGEASAMLVATEVDAADRIVYIEREQITSRANKTVNPGLWAAWLKKFTKTHLVHVARVLKPWSAIGADVDAMSVEIVETILARLDGGRENPAAVLAALESERFNEVISIISKERRCDENKAA